MTATEVSIRREEFESIGASSATLTLESMRYALDRMNANESNNFMPLLGSARQVTEYDESESAWERYYRQVISPEEARETVRQRGADLRIRNQRDLDGAIENRSAHRVLWEEYQRNLILRRAEARESGVQDGEGSSNERTND